MSSFEAARLEKEWIATLAQTEFRLPIYFAAPTQRLFAAPKPGEAAGGLDDAAGDLAAIGDQDTREHAAMVTPREFLGFAVQQRKSLHGSRREKNKGRPCHRASVRSSNPNRSRRDNRKIWDASLPQAPCGDQIRRAARRGVT